MYGFEYKPGNDGYITWVSENTRSWTVMQSGMGPDSVSGAGQRLVSQEPMVRHSLEQPSLYQKGADDEGFA